MRAPGTSLAVTVSAAALVGALAVAVVQRAASGHRSAVVGAAATRAAAPPARDAADRPTIPADPITPAADPITPAAAAGLRTAVAAAVRRAAAQGITEHVVVLDRHTGRTLVAVDPDTPVPAMSVAKLLFAVDVLDSAGGPAHVDPATLGRLHVMVATSDDAIASAVYTRGGAGQIVQRMAARYRMVGTRPSPEPRYWGDIRITARDMASFLAQVLADPHTGPFLASAMESTTRTARDGYRQDFGMGAVPGAGSKQGWGCCLGGVVSIHSVGFTEDEVVAVLSTAPPDAPGLNVPEVSAFADDPGFLASVAAVTATAHAAIVPGPAPLPVQALLTAE